jgi:hypothetical protein
MPPVSTRVNFRPAHSASALTRSRVTPGWSWTMAIRFPTIRLNKALFPTFGRPTMAISPDMAIASFNRRILAKTKSGDHRLAILLDCAERMIEPKYPGKYLAGRNEKISVLSAFAAPTWPAN